MRTVSLSYGAAELACLAVQLPAAEPIISARWPILQRQCQGCHQPNLKSSNSIYHLEGQRREARSRTGPDREIPYWRDEAADAAGTAAAARRTTGPRPRLGGRRCEERYPGGSPRNRFQRQAAGLHAASGCHGASVFTRWENARRLGQSRNSASHAGWQRAAKAPVRPLGAYSFARIFQGWVDPGGGRRNTGPLGEIQLGRRIGQTTPFHGADRRYGVRRFDLTDGTRVAAGCTDNTVRIVDTASGRTLKMGAHEVGPGHCIRHDVATSLGAIAGQTIEPRLVLRKTSTCCAANLARLHGIPQEIVVTATSVPYGI